MENQISDEKLIEKIKRGEVVLFSNIIEKYEPKLSRYIRHMTKSSYDTEDVLQNVFISTFRNINSFDTNLRFSSWIYRIAHNEAINWIKKHKNNADLELLENDTDIKANEKSSFEKMSISDDVKEVKKCLNQIDMKYKEAILLRYFEDKTYQEISDILRKPTSSVGTLVSRGIKELKQKCQKAKQKQKKK